MNVTVNKKMPFWAKVICALAGAGLIWFGISSLRLVFTGVETEAEITKVESRIEKEKKKAGSDSESRKNINGDEDTYTVVTQYYSYTVDGTEYTGKTESKKKNAVKKGDHTVHKDEAFIAQKEAQKTIRVKYLPSNPAHAELASGADKSFSTVAIKIIMMLLGLVLIVLPFKAK